MQLTTYLRSLGSYKYPTELKNQVVQFINNFPGFTINIARVQRQSGPIVDLICLDGMVQTLFRGVSYNTLIKIVLDVGFPTEGGIHVFIITNLEKSHFRQVKNLDIPNNYYNVEGIPGYTRQLPLYEVIRMVSAEFSRDPPVSSGGKGQVMPRIYVIPNRVIPTATSAPSSTYGSQMYSSMYSQPLSQHNPYEISSVYSGMSQPINSMSSSGYYSTGGVGGYQQGISNIQNQSQQPTQNVQGVETISELRAKLMAVLSNEYERRKAELSSELDSKMIQIKSLKDDCERKKKEHEDSKNRVESIAKEKVDLEKRLVELQKEIKLYEDEGEPDPDTLCDPSTEWERQLLECIAKDNAYEDLIFYLNKAFEKKKLDQEQFFVSVREEAKRQFEQKTLAMKIKNEMKKIGYRPPY